MTDPTLRAEFLVAGPDCLPVRLTSGHTPGHVPLLGEGLAGGVDGVERDDVSKGSNVRIADER